MDEYDQFYDRDSRVPVKIPGITRSTYDKIKKGLKKSLIISILYQDADGNSTKRNILPELIFCSNDHWYLSGYCYLRQEERSFRMDRISSAAVSRKKGKPRNIAEKFRETGIPWMRDADPESYEIELPEHPSAEAAGRPCGKIFESLAEPGRCSCG